MNPYIATQLPLIIGFILLLLTASLRPWKAEPFSLPISLAALFLTGLLVQTGLQPGQVYFGGSIQVTATGKSLALLCLLLTGLALLLSQNYLDKVRVHPVDWRMVVLASALGMVSLCLVGDLATLFVAYELVSIPSYVLAGFASRDPRSNEAGLKYLLLGMFASLLLLLGISFVYGATGEIHLSALGDKLALAAITNTADAEASMVFARLGLVLILAALFFKTAIAPFHTWLPDVYQGTNLASLAFISSPVKVAVFGMLALLLWGPFAPLGSLWQMALLAGMVVSVVAGNLQALTQMSLKRLIAYSAVVNGAFVLLAILAKSPNALVLYLAAYGLMSLGAWAAFMAMGTKSADVDELSDLTGMGASHRWLALGLTVVLFSFAGIPLTVGFAAKFAVLYAAVHAIPTLPAGTVAVLVLLVLSSLVSFYYYFQIVRSIWFAKVEPATSVPVAGLQRTLLWNYATVLAIVVFLALTLGFFPRLVGL